MHAPYQNRAKPPKDANHAHSQLKAQRLRGTPLLRCHTGSSPDQPGATREMRMKKVH